MENPKLVPFAKKQFLNLRTYRRNGEAVATPVWFVQDEDLLYVRTGLQSGKVKRIRRNPRVDVAPCDMRGVLSADWIPAQARLVDGDQVKFINRLFNRKYGLQKVLFEIFQSSGRTQLATLEIRVD